MDIPGLLEAYDDPKYWEYPPRFKYKSEQRRFFCFASDFSAAIGLNPKIETGSLIQDASFHSQIILPPGPTACHAIRFSNFGSFIAINDDEDVPEAMLSTTLRLAEEHKYVYIPFRYLDAEYTGLNPGVTGIESWWTRYFDYV